MEATIKKEDLDFIAKFLSIYQKLSGDDQNLVLAFAQGMEFQRTLTQDST